MSQKTGSELEDIPTDTFSYEYGEEEGYFEEEEAPTILYSEDFISRPILSKDSELPEDILEFEYPFLIEKHLEVTKLRSLIEAPSFSYSYDCKRYFNLCCMEEDIVVFVSGNLMHFYNVETKELWFRRSFLGGGIGHITVNHIQAVLENIK